MNPRRWIIGKDFRICPRACLGWSNQTAAVKITDQEKGIALRKCRECGTAEECQLDSFKDRRPCKRCKNTYDVTVKLWSGREGEPPAERWKDRCSLCDLEVSAAVHYQTAKNFFARATKLRAEQQRKQIRAKASASVKALVMTEIERGAAPAIASGAVVKGLLEAEKND